MSWSTFSAQIVPKLFAGRAAVETLFTWIARTLPLQKPDFVYRKYTVLGVPSVSVPKELVSDFLLFSALASARFSYQSKPTLADLTLELLAKIYSFISLYVGATLQIFTVVFV